MTLKQFIQRNYNNLLLNRYTKSVRTNILGQELPIIKLSTKNGNKLCITISSAMERELGGEVFDMDWLYKHTDEEVQVCESNPLWCKIIKVGERININEFNAHFGI